MSLDLVLEDQDIMDYVQGNIQEPPTNAVVATKMKYRKGEIKAKMIIQDSIHKHLVAYIFELKTSKEMYDKLVSMFRARNANQILFFNHPIQERCLDINLVNIPSHLFSEGYDRSYGGVPSNKGEGLLIIDSFLLCIPLSHQPGFVLIYAAICNILDFVDPSRTYN